MRVAVSEGVSVREDGMAPILDGLPTG
jgi:hypothetical protein